MKLPIIESFIERTYDKSFYGKIIKLCTVTHYLENNVCNLILQCLIKWMKYSVIAMFQTVLVPYFNYYSGNSN